MIWMNYFGVNVIQIDESAVIVTTSSFYITKFNRKGDLTTKLCRIVSLQHPFGNFGWSVETLKGMFCSPASFGT